VIVTNYMTMATLFNVLSFFRILIFDRYLEIVLELSSNIN